MFGNIVVERTDTRVSTRLESDDSIVVTIERSGPRKRKRVPIGTRKADRLSARINDRKIALSPGKGILTLRSYRVVAEIEGRYLSLRPVDVESSLFIGGKPNEAEKEFGELTAGTGGTIDMVWAVPRTVTILKKSVEITPPEPTIEDLLIGYAMAAAFGTGGLPLTAVVLGLMNASQPV